MKTSLSREEAQTIAHLLAESYPGLHPFLDAKNPFESLIATILSAQTTDRQVNKVTPALFQAYPDPAHLSQAQVEEVIPYIHSIGFFRSKSKNIIATARKLMDDFQGEVPREMDELTALPGVGRKTANVVRANAFGYPAMPVDTHVFRVANRLGLSQSKTPDECEQDLRALLDPSLWNYFHLSIIMHGRTCCLARRPHCESCPLQAYCRTYQEAQADQ